MGGSCVQIKVKCEETEFSTVETVMQQADKGDGEGSIKPREGEEESIPNPED